jgi:hypothetical protein
MAIIKLSRVERRRISAFITCFLLAFGAWVFVTMSNYYTYPVKIALNFKDQPLRKAFYALQADTINAVVGGTGWQKFFNNFSSQNRSVDVDVRKLDFQNFIVLSNQLPQINQKSEKNQQIISFNPDTVFFDFTARKVKRVPVILKSRINYQKQYARSDDVTIQPNYITISGPAAYIDSVKAWKTDSLIVENANTNISSRINLLSPKENNISIYPKTVDVTIPVDEFTEKTLEVPVKLINNKSYSNVVLIPKKVKITFTVSLNNYADINNDFFEVVADLDNWQKEGKITLPVTIKQKPDYCKIVRVQPTSINFIVRK